MGLSGKIFNFRVNTCLVLVYPYFNITKKEKKCALLSSRHVRL